MCFAPQRRALFRHLNWQKWSKREVFSHLQMCFAPKRRALFRRLNFQKCSEREVFWAFSLANVLCAKTACTFSTSQLPKAFSTWSVFSVFTCKCASRHNGVQFFISHLASAPAALASLLFNPPEPQIIGKTVFRDFPTFSCTGIFFLLRLSLFDLLSSSLLFPDSSHLCFSFVHIVGSLTSKLSSIMLYDFS